MQLLPRLKISPLVQNFIIHFALCLPLGLFWYWVLYDRFPLYVSHVNWIYVAGGDALQHQLGWEWFRQEPWRWPLGLIQAYGYPSGTSVTFMDSIPLFAVPFKLLSPWLEQQFQYFGIWELCSVMGQLLMGMLILQEFNRSYWLKILGASLLVLSPPMIFRAFYHSSLSAHWILLAAIWFILLEYRHRLWRGAWLVLFAMAVWIHVYFIPMLIPLWMVGLFFRYKSMPRKWRLLLDVVGMATVIFLAGASIGLFSLNFHSLSEGGFGSFSWNLNGFFNPFDFSSAYLKKMVTGTSGQYEGFSYLGLGILMMLPAAVYLFLEKDFSRRRLAFILPVSAAALVYTLFALSNKAFLNEQPLWDIPLSSSVLEFFNLFRTSGRFIWPVFYLLVLFGIISVIRNLRFAVPVLILVLLLQYSDLQPLYQSKKLPGPITYRSDLKAEFWQQAATANRHVVVIPGQKLSQADEPVAIYAVHNRLTLNVGYFARSDERVIQGYAEQVWKDLLAGRADPHTIYLMTQAEWIKRARANLSDEMFICEVDGYTVLFSTENELARTEMDLAPYCSTPTP